MKLSFALWTGLASAAAITLLMLSSAQTARKNSPANNTTAYVPPLGLPAIPDRKRNNSIQKIKLGKDLFFEPALSRDGKISCASCHVPEQAFTQNGVKTSSGFNSQKNRRNTPTLLNAAYYKRLHQDGRETSLHTQFLLPLTAPDEMASRSVGYVIEKLGWISDYHQRFQKIYGQPMTVDTLGDALAAYQETLVSANSRFDRWRFGKETSLLTEQELEGFKLFTEKAECESCHKIENDHALFTDQGFHDIGLGWLRNNAKSTGNTDLGRFEVTGQKLDKWRYRTPSLRNIALTAPYMHDGSLSTLEEVIEFYNKGGAPHPGQDERIKPLNLSKKDIQALKAFLLTLTGDNLKHLVRSSRTE